ncbi:response regulator [Indioceanicola profundi]|uniref:response regulator n=1 Tax=Indioceanicola profundi TaxID=2220096 RepID=UPI0013C4C3A6|nr:response regulator [Indioceanicola profundi]
MGLRVLVAEDDVLIAMQLGSILEDLGHDACWFATSGPEAMELARRHKPDLVTMDGHLAAGTSGILAASAISSTLGIPVVMVSGHLDAQTAQDAGAVVLVGKPFQPADIENALHIACKLRLPTQS